VARADHGVGVDETLREPEAQKVFLEIHLGYIKQPFSTICNMCTEDSLSQHQQVSGVYYHVYHQYVEGVYFSWLDF
jgi:hypothetical protein